MNWIKENKSLAAILGVMIAGAVALAALLFMSYTAYNESVEKWKTTSENVKRLKSAKLYPDTTNVAAKEKMVSEYADKVNLLRATLLDPKVQQPVKPISETEFQAKLKDRANTVKRLAEGSQVLLPADFALGFDEYTGSLPRTPEVAADLNVHLDVMEKLVTALIQSGVKSVDLLERTKLPNEKAAVAAPVIAPRATKAKPNSKGKNKTIITAAAAAEPVLDRYPIKLMLTTDQGPFQNLMNTLANPSKLPHFLVVRQLRVENEKLDGPLKSEIRISRDAVSPETSNAPAAAPSGAPAGTQVIVPPKAAPKDAITIMGEEKLKLYLEVDYVRFRPAAEVEEVATPAATAAVTN
ncbi:Amuc_1100 family pilus-like protein [Verrucomicrobium spinosum]|uniref:Amuc_1100 family pilus-like protein n=1 Tax=Verrucomicrobium spinosum TaxID=2736 RepID=UPI0001746042|nr:Amuc_1100 family pilus-like protein [Verrucomicrobium spinosum]